MELRQYKDSNTYISLLGFGCMRLPKKGEEIDYNTAFSMIDYAYEHGVNYFDTAYPYHGGKSELFIGEALKKYPRDSFYLADKLPPWACKQQEDVAKIFNEQLQKCQVDYFDFYLLHNLNDENYKKFEDFHAYEYLAKMKAEGKIKRLGFSFHGTVDLLKQIVEDHEWDFAQIQYNYLDCLIANAQKEYDILEKEQIPVIIMEPVRGGALADLCSEANALLKAAAPDKSIPSWAIRYAASQENVLTVLSGMSTMEQVTDNIATMTEFQTISKQEQAVIDKAAAVFRQYFTVPCTKCRYCMKDCPEGIDIPEMLRLYGQYNMEKDDMDYSKEYHQVSPEARAVNCIACRVCEGMCPQGIHISEIMDNLKKLNEKIRITD